MRSPRPRMALTSGLACPASAGYHGGVFWTSIPGVVALRARPRANIVNPFRVLSQGSTESRPTILTPEFWILNPRFRRLRSAAVGYGRLRSAPRGGGVFPHLKNAQNIVTCLAPLK